MEMHLNQYLLLGAGLSLTFAFGMFICSIAMLLFIGVIYAQHLKQSAATFQHISFDTKHDN